MSRVIQLHQGTHSSAPDRVEPSLHVRYKHIPVLPLQVHANGAYAGGFPMFMYQIFSRFRENPCVSLEKELAYLEDSVPYTFRLEEVSFVPLDEKTLRLHKAPHDMTYHNGQKGYWQGHALKPKALEKKWLRIVRGGDEDFSPDTMEQQFCMAAQLTEKIITKINTEIACNDSVQSSDLPQYLEHIRDSLMHDINQAFLENYADYLATPDHNKRTFQYLNLNL